VRVATVQFAPRLGEPEANRAAMRRLLLQADGADLVVLPELASSGYHFEDAAQAAATAEPADGETADLLHGLCRSHGFHAVCGLNERAGARRYNAAIVVGPDGLVGVYRKNHLFANEKRFFEPGDLGWPVFEIAGARVAPLVCYDYSFPESWGVLMRAGVDVVAHPSNFVLAGRAQRVVPVMALLHRLYVATANRSGEDRGLRFTGESLIAAPSGEILASSPAEGEHVAVVEVDLAAARDKQLTPTNHLLGDRRPELYASLLEPDG
jgi:predicted amidohydrolase